MSHVTARRILRGFNSSKPWPRTLGNFVQLLDGYPAHLSGRYFPDRIPATVSYTSHNEIVLTFRHATKKATAGRYSVLKTSVNALASAMEAHRKSKETA